MMVAAAAAGRWAAAMHGEEFEEGPRGVHPRAGAADAPSSPTRPSQRNTSVIVQHTPPKSRQARPAQTSAAGTKKNMREENDNKENGRRDVYGDVGCGRIRCGVPKEREGDGG